MGMKEGDPSVASTKIYSTKIYLYMMWSYNRETQLIKDAKSLGLKNSGGLGMLFISGAAAFELWTGKNAPVEVMRRGFRGRIEKECRKK